MYCPSRARWVDLMYVCVHFVISLSKIRYALLNDVCCEVGWSGRKKFLVELWWDFFVAVI